MEQHHPDPATAVRRGLLRSVGNPIGSLLMAKARVDISFKFNVFKTFLFIPAIIVGGHMAGAIGVTLGFLLVQIVNTVLSYFVMIKPVLGPSYRQYILSLWLPFYLSLPTLAVSYGPAWCSTDICRWRRCLRCRSRQARWRLA